jgi:uncharacterized protein
MIEKEKKLEDIIKSYKSAVVAYSGGVDSSLLLYLTSKYLGKDKTLALIADSETYPEKERLYAIDFCKKYGINYQVIHTEELKDKRFSQNPIDRCYFCKSHLFEDAIKIKESIGFDIVFEGSNVDDLKDYRPGRKAVEEKGIISPLLLAGFTKNDIREMSKRYNLPTYNKPAKACLASRIPYGEQITIDLLKKIDSAENFLESLGFSVVRVRAHNSIARIEVEEKDFNKIIEMRGEVISKLRELGFYYITLDLEGFRSGSMNKVIESKRSEW